MGKLGDMARVTFSGKPEEGGLMYDAWLVWKHARYRAGEQGRKDLAGEINESLGEGWRLAGQPREYDGIPGVLWLGRLSDARFTLWRDQEPYGYPRGAAEEEREAADAAWLKLHKYVTFKTVNASRAGGGDRAPRGANSLWWVRDTFNGTELLDPASRRLIEIIKGGGPVPVVTPEAARDRAVTRDEPAGQEEAGRFTCRYVLAAGCERSYPSNEGLLYHEEQSEDHASDRITLLPCPECLMRFHSAKGRAQHLSRAHGITRGSARRLELDALQTLELWEARERGRAAALVPEPDRDVAVGVAGMVRTVPMTPEVPAVPVTAVPLPDSDDPAIGALMELIERVRKAEARGGGTEALEREIAELRVKAARYDEIQRLLGGV